MKHLFLFALGLILLTFPSCKKTEIGNLLHARHVNGTEATLAWQECVFFTDQLLNVCFVDAVENRCPCQALCFTAGSIDVTLRITSITGLDTTVVLTSFGNHLDDAQSSVTVEGRTITFVQPSTPTPSDCGNYGDFEKYKIIVTVK